MSDRLEDLRRQRALAQQQVEWLDREIARESGVAPKAPASVPPPPRAPIKAAAAPEVEKSSTDQEAEKILERFRHAGHPVRDEVKRGCLIYFFGAFAVLIVALVAFYFLKRNGIILAPPAEP